MDAAKGNRHRHPEVFDQVVEILEMVGVGAMSDDETDTEGRRRIDKIDREAKGLRRVRLSWVNEELSALFDCIETYFQAIEDEQFKDLRGNRPLRRDRDYRRVDTTRTVQKGLPINFYDPTWLRSLPPATRRRLNARPEMPIPHLVRLRFHGTDVQTTELFPF